MASRLWLPTDPPSVRPTGAPRIFDSAPNRNLGQPRLKLSPGLLNLVIATALELGCPPDMAEQARYNEHRALELAAVWFAVDRAAAGEQPFPQVVDRVRTAWRNGQHVGEILAASEQPADAGELQTLMGLD